MSNPCEDQDAITSEYDTVLCGYPNTLSDLPGKRFFIVVKMDPEGKITLLREPNNRESSADEMSCLLLEDVEPPSEPSYVVRIRTEDLGQCTYPEFLIGIPDGDTSVSCDVTVCFLIKGQEHPCGGESVSQTLVKYAYSGPPLIIEDDQRIAIQVKTPSNSQMLLIDFRREDLATSNEQSDEIDAITDIGIADEPIGGPAGMCEKTPNHSL